MAEAFQLYIDGAFCNAEASATFESLDPSTAKTWALMPRANAADTDRAVRAAYAAFNGGVWPALALGIKAQVFPVEGSRLSNVAESFALQNAPSI